MQQRESAFQRPLQDLLAVWLPHMVLLAAVMMGACYLYDSTMKMLLYAVVPESHKNWISFGILWMQELWLLQFALGIIVPMWQFEVIAFGLVNNSLTAIADTAFAK